MGVIFQKMDRNPAKISFRNDGTNFTSYNEIQYFTDFKLEELKYEVA